MSVAAFVYCRVFTAIATYLNIALNGFQSLTSGVLDVTLLLCYTILTLLKNNRQQCIEGQ